MVDDDNRVGMVWIQSVFAIKAASERGLDGKEVEACGGIVTEDERDGGAAESADTVEEDHAFVRELHRAVG